MPKSNLLYGAQRRSAKRANGKNTSTTKTPAINHNQTTINALSFLLLSKLTRPHHPGFSCYDTMIIDAMNVIVIRVQ